MLSPRRWTDVVSRFAYLKILYHWLEFNNNERHSQAKTLSFSCKPFYFVASTIGSSETFFEADMIWAEQLSSLSEGDTDLPPAKEASQTSDHVPALVPATCDTCSCIQHRSAATKEAAALLTVGASIPSAARCAENQWQTR